MKQSKVSSFDNYNFSGAVELSTKEINEIEGGSWWSKLAVAAAIVAFPVTAVPILVYKAGYYAKQYDCNRNGC